MVERTMTADICAEAGTAAPLQLRHPISSSLPGQLIDIALNKRHTGAEHREHDLGRLTPLKSRHDLARNLDRGLLTRSVVMRCGEGFVEATQEFQYLGHERGGRSINGSR